MKLQYNGHHDIVHDIVQCHDIVSLTELPTPDDASGTVARTGPGAYRHPAPGRIRIRALTTPYNAMTSQACGPPASSDIALERGELSSLAA